MEAPPERWDGTLLGQTIGSYRIESLVGRGGMGEVYRAHDERLDRTVAVKALPDAYASDEHARRRFLRETRVASQVIHPYVATVFDVVEDTGRLFLVMEFIEGRTLGRAIRDELPGSREVVRYGLEIAEALVAIHGHGLVHRDLKPGNVMLDSSGHVKVMDFGVARQMGPPPIAASTERTRTAADEITGDATGAGTIIYMSPEQVRGQEVDHRSDLFSLGVVLYQTLTGEHPFLRATVLETASAILHDPPGGGEEPRTLSQAGPLRQVILRLLEKGSEQRYQETSSVVEDLRALASGEPLPARHWPRPGVSRVRRRLLFVAGVAAVAALAVVAGWVALRPDPAAAERRPLVAVLPFEDRTLDSLGALRGQMLADLLGTDLAESPHLQTMPLDRVLEILRGLPRESLRAGQVDALRRLTPVRWLLAGTLWQEGDSYHATVDLYDRAGASPRDSFRVAAASTAAVVDLASARLVGILFPEHRGDGDDDPEAASLASASEEARRLEYEARRALGELRLREAIEGLERAVAIDPRFLRARIELALALSSAGFEERAREVAQAARNLVDGPLGPPSPRLELLSRATLAAVRGEVSAEEEFRRELAESYPDEPELELKLVEVRNRMGRSTEESLAVIDRILARDPENPRFHLHRAETLRRMGRYQDALASLDRADALFGTIASSLGHWDVVTRRGHVASARGDHEAAASLYQTAVEGLREADAEARAAAVEIAAGTAELMLGRLGSAERRFQSALRVARATGQYRAIVAALHYLGSRQYQTGHLEEAVASLREAVALARPLGNPRLLLGPLLQLGMVLGYQGQRGESRGLGEEALALARSAGESGLEVQALRMLADLDLQEGKLQASLRGYEDILRHQRSEVGTEAGLGFTLASKAEVLDTLGATAGALAAIDEAIDLERKRGHTVYLAYALLRRGLLRAQVGQWDGAAADLTEAEVLATSEEGSSLEDLVPRLAVARGKLALARGEPDQAAAHLDSALRTGTASSALGVAVPALTASCQAALLRGEGAAAVGWCRQAVDHPRALPAERTEARALLAWVLSRHGDRSRAATEARRALDEASGMRLPLAEAWAAAALLAIPVADQGPEALRRRGWQALERYVQAAPEGDRDAVRSRADLLDLTGSLRPAE